MSARSPAYVYVRSESQLWTVGTYAGGTWAPESDHATPEDAAARVNYLNGGSPVSVSRIANDGLIATLREIHLIAVDAQLRASYQRTALDSISAKARAELAKAGAA